MAYEDIQNVQRHRRKEDAVSEQDDMGYVGESRIPWSDVEGAPKMPKPLPSIRDVAERIYKTWIMPLGGDVGVPAILADIAELIDAYVTVRVAEKVATESEWWRGHGAFISTFNLAERRIETSAAALIAARERWEKIT